MPQTSLQNQQILFLFKYSQHTRALSTNHPSEFLRYKFFQIICYKYSKYNHIYLKVYADEVINLNSTMESSSLQNGTPLLQAAHR